MRIPDKSVSAVIAGLALSLFLIPARAQPPKIDFDHEVDSPQILDSIRRQTPIIAIDKATLLPAMTALRGSDFAKTGPIAGVNVPDRIHNSEPYDTASQYPPLIEVLDPADRDPLKADWNEINTIRTGLLSEATALEKEDWALYERALTLDRNAERLNLRAEKLSAEIDNFNRTCTGRPLPPDEYNACLRWQTDLTQRLREHKAEVEQHNRNVDQWYKEADDLRNRIGTTGKGIKQKNVAFIGRAAAWEQQKIAPFINRAAAAVRRRNVSSIRLQAQRGAALDASEAFNKPGPITLSECLSTMDRLWLKLTPSQQQVRLNAHVAVREWMRRMAAGGGSGPTAQIPFYDQYPHADDDPRFDGQVIRGIACVPDDCCRK